MGVGGWGMRDERWGKGGGEIKNGGKKRRRMEDKKR